MTDVSGVLRDTQGNPLTGVNVTVQYKKAIVGYGGGGVVQNVRQFTTDGAGLLTMDGLIPGSYDLFVWVQENDTTAQTLKQKTTIVVLNQDNQSLESALQAIVDDITSSILQQAIDAKVAAEAARDTINTPDGSKVSASFDGRAALVTSWNDLSAAEKEAYNGAIFSDGTVSYVVETGATAISDLPGLVPYGIHTPMHHGAVADGSTDDTAAIQAAINAVEAVSGDLFFPEGTYITTAQLTLDTGGVTLFGTGRKSILKTDANVNIIRATGVSEIHVRDLAFHGNGTGSNQDGIRCINVTDSVFRGLHAKGVGHDGILLISGCIGNSVIGCHVDGTGDDGINIGGDSGAPASQNNTVTGNIIENCANDGIHVSDTSEGTSVTGNVSFSNGHGIGLFNAKRVSISGNILRSNTGRGIHTPSGTCTDVTITGNLVSGGERGINIDAGSNFTITGNSVLSASDYGIVISGPSNVVVASNQINAGCSVAAIFLSSAEDTTVTGNSIDDCGGDGVYINSDATFFCSRVTVSNNTINNPGDEGIEVESGEDSNHIRITGNIVYSPGGRGIEYRGGPYFNISGNSIVDAGDYGILVSAATLQAGKGHVCGNTVEGGCTTEGIRANNYNILSIQENVVYDITGSRGINVLAGSAIVGGNLVEDTISASTEGVLVASAPSGTTLGSVSNKIEVFDKTGASLGFMPVYDAIT